MKIVTYLQGFVFLNFSADDVSPPTGIVTSALVNLVSATYRFAASQPDQMQKQISFQSGEFSKDGVAFAISQLGFMATGIWVVTQTTENADAVLDHLVPLLDKSLQFRLGGAKTTRRYASNLVAQFDGAISKYVESLGKVEDIINRSISTSSGEPSVFQLKRLSFGKDGPALPFVSVAEMEKADFVIDRREGSPFSENRFFCSAPLRTQELVQTMENIEHAMAQK